jgi:transcription antitermination factor NusG
MNPLNHQWYALRVQSKRADAASAVLRGKGYDEFLPIYREHRRWSDRIKVVEAPLFPGYLFCRFDPNDRLVPVVTTPGVIGIVSAGRNPLPVPENEIERIRRIVDSGLDAKPWPFLAAGARVSIEFGPLAGLEGIVTSADDGFRLVASVTLLQRSVAVALERHWVRPLACTPMAGLPHWQSKDLTAGDTPGPKAAP